MDPNESTLPVSISDARPVSPSPITVSAVTAPATVKEEKVEERVEEEKVKEKEENNGGESSAKRKRGRPRKCDSKGKSIKLSGTPERSLDKTKGDPYMNLGGGDLTAHIFTVNTNEDIIERIMSFTQNGSRGICVLAANGAVSNVKIQPLGFLRNVLTFKDAYEIVTLNGTMVTTENGEVRNDTGGWKISIGGVDGCVFGGRLAGRLIAASPVQVVIGSFWPMIFNPSLKRNNESKAVIVTPTVPNGLDSTSTGQVQEPEVKDTDLSLGGGCHESGSEPNP